MTHRVIVEVLQEDDRTLEVTPVGGVRTSAPLLPRGEILEFGGQEYVVLAVRQQLMGHLGGDAWDAVTTYLVDEVEDEDAASGKGMPPFLVDELSEFLRTGKLREPEDWGNAA